MAASSASRFRQSARAEAPRPTRKTIRDAMALCDQLEGLSPELLVYVLGQIAAKTTTYSASALIFDAAAALQAEARIKPAPSRSAAGRLAQAAEARL